jgi:hypothetical protein
MGLLLIGVLAGCGKDSAGITGLLEVQWTGADSGRLEVPAHARWCDSDSALEIAGIQADSGAALALFPSDSLRPGVYPVGVPTGVSARPGARVALRRFGENLILGYYSMSGTVTLDSAAPLHGSLQATLVGVNTGDQIVVTGRFRNVEIEPGEVTCGTPRGNPTDTSIR